MCGMLWMMLASCVYVKREGSDGGRGGSSKQFGLSSSAKEPIRTFLVLLDACLLSSINSIVCCGVEDRVPVADTFCRFGEYFGFASSSASLRRFMDALYSVTSLVGLVIVNTLLSGEGATQFARRQVAHLPRRRPIPRPARVRAMSYEAVD